MVGILWGLSAGAIGFLITHYWGNHAGYAWICGMVFVALEIYAIKEI